MKVIRSGAVLVCLILVFGCVPSLHPLFTDDDITFDEALVGTWTEEDDDREKWAFTKEGDKSYQLVYTDNDGKTGEFLVHLVKVEGRLYLDLFPAELQTQSNDFYKYHLRPVHTFMRVKTILPELQMAPLNPDKVGKILEEDPTQLRHEIIDDSLLLSAPPREIQAFLAKNDTVKDVWGDFSKLKKLSTQPASQPVPVPAE